MKQLGFSLFLMLWISLGCSETNYFEQGSIYNTDLTKKFEQQKGQMMPVGDYRNSILSQNIVREAYWIGYPITDRQIFVCDNSCIVKSVSEGQVFRVIKSGVGIIVIVKSGKYSSIYGHLSQVTVKEGEIVTNETSIGYGVDSEPVFFEVRKEGVKLNPSEWIRF